MATPRRNRPLVALRALRELVRDPDDLPQVFAIIDALPGKSLERILARTRRSDTGRRLLAARPALDARLSDRAALAALPPGTLGRAYFELTEQAKISAQGIVDASMATGEPEPATDPDLRWVGERMRDSHDLWHVVTGYQTDVIGELALLAFTLAQAPHLGIGLIVGFGYLQGYEQVNEHIRKGFRRGRRAAWLPAVEWETLLDQPLDVVRARLRIDELPVYEPISSAALRSGQISLRVGASA
jgi:ubiquinone biosynthesis protein COQ4